MLNIYYIYSNKQPLITQFKPQHVMQTYTPSHSISLQKNSVETSRYAPGQPSLPLANNPKQPERCP